MLGSVQYAQLAYDSSTCVYQYYFLTLNKFSYFHYKHGIDVCNLLLEDNLSNLGIVLNLNSLNTFVEFRGSGKENDAWRKQNCQK